MIFVPGYGRRKELDKQRVLVFESLGAINSRFHALLTMLGQSLGSCRICLANFAFLALLRMLGQSPLFDILRVGVKTLPRFELPVCQAVGDTDHCHHGCVVVDTIHRSFAICYCRTRDLERAGYVFAIHCRTNQCSMFNVLPELPGKEPLKPEYGRFPNPK